MTSSKDKNEIYFEFHPIGHTLKVTAIDSLTGTEASILGPATAPHLILQQAAVRKLHYVLKGKR